MMFLVHETHVNRLSCLWIVWKSQHATCFNSKQSVTLEISAGNATGRFTISPVHFHSPMPPLMQVPSQMRAAAIRFGEEPHSQSRFTHIEHVHKRFLFMKVSHLKSSSFNWRVWKRLQVCEEILMLTKSKLIFEIICQARVYKVKRFRVVLLQLPISLHLSKTTLSNFFLSLLSRLT